MSEYVTRNLNKKKLLCFSDKYLLFVKGIKVYCTDKNNNEVFVQKIPVKNNWMQILSYISLPKRALRLEPRCGIFVDSDIAVVSYHGSIYRIDIKERSICLEHKFIEGMNNPLSFTQIENIDGFTNGIVYGEYTNDGVAKEVSIYQRSQQGKWEKLFTFPKGTAKHIHALLPSSERDSVFVFTGDSDVESGIWEFKNNFTTINKSLTGKQIYRACVANIKNNQLTYISDMPDKENFVYSLNWDAGEESLTKIMSVSGPCIYGTQLVNGELVFSTSVEGDSTVQGWRSWLSFSTGVGVKDRYSHVYIGNSRIGFKDIYKMKKDNYPLRLFGFGTFSFPKGNMEKITIVANCLKGIAGNTIILENKTGDQLCE